MPRNSFLKEKLKTTLRYVDTISIDPGSAGIASHVFMANGLYDTDVTGTGHQPLGFDELAALYTQYRVTSSDIKVTPVSAGTASTVPALIGVFRDSDATLSYTLGTAIIEDPRVSNEWGCFGEKNGPDPAVRKYSLDAHYNAKRDMSPETADNATTMSANPSGSYASYWQVWAASVYGNDPGSVEFVVEINFRVEFTEPLHLTQS